VTVTGACPGPCPRVSRGRDRRRGGHSGRAMKLSGCSVSSRPDHRSAPPRPNVFARNAPTMSPAASVESTTAGTRPRRTSSQLWLPALAVALREPHPPRRSRPTGQVVARAVARRAGEVQLHHDHQGSLHHPARPPGRPAASRSAISRRRTQSARRRPDEHAALCGRAVRWPMS
jgi:hypothetical protein